MDETEVLRQINEFGESAYGLLLDADPKLVKRFEKLDAELVKLLADVRKHFPDAQYYTASGGFNLLLGSPQTADRMQYGQPELVALQGRARIGDGDF